MYNPRTVVCTHRTSRAQILTYQGRSNLSDHKLQTQPPLISREWGAADGFSWPPKGKRRLQQVASGPQEDQSALPPQGPRVISRIGGGGHLTKKDKCNPRERCWKQNFQGGKRKHSTHRWKKERRNTRRESLRNKVVFTHSQTNC